MHAAMSDRFKAVVFDLDGTLVDTAPDLAATLNHVLGLVGRPAVALEEIRAMVGDGVARLIERGLAASGPPVDAETFERLRAEYVAHYGAHIADASRPFPRLREILAELRGAGRALGVCTNKPLALTEKLLAALDLRRVFGAVVGGDSLPERKPDPAPLRLVLRRLGVEPAKAVMIGDSNNDLLTARAAGIPCVLVTFGYTVRPVEELGADALISDFGDLPRALARLS
jgi:phosphoglycolate phosphatase